MKPSTTSSNLTKNDRRINRPKYESLFFPVSFRIKIDTDTIEASVTNYHFRGACLSIPAAALETLLDAAPEDVELSCHMGVRLLRDKIPFRIVWTDSNGHIGIEFLISTRSFIPRPDRFYSHSFIAPTLSCADPLNPNRLIYFKVTCLSLGGLGLTTSLTNHHLLVGMELNNCHLNFPNGSTVKVHLRIQNIRSLALQGVFTVGTAIPKASKHYIEQLGNYVASLSDSPIAGSRSERIRKANLLPKALRTNLSFRVAETQSDYDRVLQLRFEAYKRAGKVPSGTKWHEMGDGLGEEGILVTGFLGGELIATMELRFSDSSTPPKILKKIPPEQQQAIDVSRTVEISRFAILPHVQGTDTVVGMMQKVHSLLVMRGGYDVLITATPALAPLYERTGFKRTGTKVPHSVLPDVLLDVMYLKKETYGEGKFLNPLAWKTMFLENQKLAVELGLQRTLAWNRWRSIQAAGLGKVLQLASIFKKKRKR